MSPNEPRPPSACWKQDGGQVVLEISGAWRRDGPAPVIEGEPPDKSPDRYHTEALAGFREGEVTIVDVQQVCSEC